MLVCGMLTVFRVLLHWKMVSLCLLWCLWRERNDINFEDRDYFFKTLYFWTIAFDSFLVSYHDFLFCFLILAKCVFLYIS
jgi:hypothetical protein